MLDKIKKEIAQQTREDLGFVKMANSRGFHIVNSPTEKTKIPDTDIIIPENKKFIWTQKRYIFDRASRTENGIITTPIPVYDMETFVPLFPNLQLSKHYFDITNHSNISDGQLSNINIDGGQSGAFKIEGLAHQANNVFSIQIEGGDRNELIPMTLSANGIGISVWTGEGSNISLIYSSNIDGLNNSISFSVPISTTSTNLIICSYSHGDPSVFGTELYESLCVTNKYLEVEVDLTNRVISSNPDDPQNDLDRQKIITWYEDRPIVSTVNPLTNNINNNLFFVKSNNPRWDHLEIYKRDYNNFTIDETIENTEQFDTIIVDTVNSSLFNIRDKILVGSEEVEDRIQAVFKVFANKLYNLTSYVDSSLTYWDQVGTSVGTIPTDRAATSYPCLSDYLYNNQSWEFSSILTDTTQSYYIENLGYERVSEDSYIRVNYKDVINSSNIPKIKLMWYSSSDGSACTVSSVVPDLFNYSHKKTGSWAGENGWTYVRAQLKYDDFEIPDDCVCTRVRFYGIYETTAEAKVRVAGFHLGETGNSWDTPYIFNSESTDKTAITLYHNYDKQMNRKGSARTMFNTIFDSTVESRVTWLNQPSHLRYGSTQFVDTSFFNPKFTSGLKIVDSAYNFIANGDFNGGGNHWDSSDGFYWESTAGATPYGSTYAHFTGVETAYSYIQQSTSSMGSYSGAVGVAVWAKSDNNETLRICIEDSSGAVSSADFILTNEWERYSTYLSEVTRDTVMAKLAVNNPTTNWQIDIAGVQMEPSYFPFDFNYLDTTQGSFRTGGSLYYSTGIPMDHGTIRFWYTPLLNSRETKATTNPLGYHGLFYTGQGNNYKTIYYDIENQEFVFRQRDGVDYYSSKVKKVFEKNEPIHVVASWDSSLANLYIDRKKDTNNVVGISTGNPVSFYVGWALSASSSYSANGVFSNFRIDPNKWTWGDIYYDYSSDYISYTNEEPLKHYTEKMIGTKVVDGGVSAENTSLLKFTDEQGLSPNTEYGYSFISVRDDGYKTAMSEEKRIKTTRTSWEWILTNKIPNSSFEVVDVFSGNPLYWDSSESYPSQATLNTDNYYSGTKSLKVTNNDYYVSEYISISNTADSHYLSFYLNGADYGWNHDSKIDIYDIRYNLLDSLTLDENDFSTSSGLGEDGNYWVRYFVEIITGLDGLTEADYKASRYWKIGFKSGHPGGSYFDCIQLEESELTDYREGYFVGSGQLGANAVDGNAVAFDCLVGRHLQAGELVVSGHSSDANRIVIGEETAAAAFAILSPDHFWYHPAGASSNSGWNYTKHIEYGENYTFGVSTSFGERFVDWNGNGQTPVFIVTPNIITTFSTAISWPEDFSHMSSSVYPQKLQFTSDATPGGFTVGATLSEERSSGTEYAHWNSLYVNNSTHNWCMEMDYDTEEIHTIYGTSAFPINPSGSNLYVGLQTNGSAWTGTWTKYGPTGSGFLIQIWATSTGTTTFNDSTWCKLKDYYLPYAEAGMSGDPWIDIQIYNSNINRMNVIGYLIKTQAAETCYIKAYGFTAQYSTSSSTVLKENSDIGTYNWVAIDGGIFG